MVQAIAKAFIPVRGLHSQQQTHCLGTAPQPRGQRLEVTSATPGHREETPSRANQRLEGLWPWIKSLKAFSKPPLHDILASKRSTWECGHYGGTPCVLLMLFLHEKTPMHQECSKRGLFTGLIPGVAVNSSLCREEIQPPGLWFRDRHRKSSLPASCSEPVSCPQTRAISTTCVPSRMYIHKKKELFISSITARSDGEPIGFYRDMGNM